MRCLRVPKAEPPASIPVYGYLVGVLNRADWLLGGPWRQRERLVGPGLVPSRHRGARARRRAGGGSLWSTK